MHRERIPSPPCGNRDPAIADNTRDGGRGDKPPTLYGDIIGGITTFFAMAYIVVVNPSILSTPGTGMSFTGAMTATVLIALSMTLLMGLYARLPFAVAPGMGLNAFFAFTIVLQQHVPWQTALGMVFWAGVLFLAVSATPLRETIAMAIPSGVRLAAAAGIGLLLTLIDCMTPDGLKRMPRPCCVWARSIIGPRSCSSACSWR